jgi:uncharacterized protein
MSKRFAVRMVRGPAWNPALPLRQQVLWDEHAAFMDALTANGFVVLGGPLGGEEGSLLIIDAEDEATIRARLADDPWSKSDQLRVGRIDSWTILLDSTGRLSRR